MVNDTFRVSRAALWWGMVITVLGALSNGLYFLYLPGQAVFPWINLLVPIAGLLIVIVGVWRAFAHPESYGGKWLGAVFTVICLVLVGGSTFGFFHARDLPRSAAAPRVGQKAPDFTLVDSTGQTISLTQLLSGPGQPPKGVLLIFYRGYW